MISQERRVYVLPCELLARVRRYQRDMLCPSEVEAVRRLLDQALLSRDTLSTLLMKLQDRSVSLRNVRGLAQNILAGHPLVTRIEFDGPTVNFEMTSGQRGTFQLTGVGV